MISVVLLTVELSTLLLTVLKLHVLSNRIWYENITHEWNHNENIYTCIDNDNILEWWLLIGQCAEQGWKRLYRKYKKQKIG